MGNKEKADLEYLCVNADGTHTGDQNKHPPPFNGWQATLLDEPPFVCYLPGEAGHVNQCSSYDVTLWPDLMYL